MLDHRPGMLIIALWVGTNGVNAQTSDTVQRYLGLNGTQQEIFIRRQANAQETLVAECAPGADVAALRAYFNDWLESRPQFLNRSTQLAFTRALTDRCLADDR